MRRSPEKPYSRSSAPRVVAEERSDKPRGPFDLGEAFTLTAGLLTLIFAFGEVTTSGWTHGKSLGGFSLAVALLAAFWAIERRAGNPMMPPAIVRLRSVRVANLAAVLVFGTFCALFYFASIFMQQVYGDSPVTAGLAYLPLAVAVVVGAGIASASAAARRTSLCRSPRSPEWTARSRASTRASSTPARKPAGPSAWRLSALSPTAASPPSIHSRRT